MSRRERVHPHIRLIFWCAIIIMLAALFAFWMAYQEGSYLYYGLGLWALGVSAVVIHWYHEERNYTPDG